MEKLSKQTINIIRTTQRNNIDLTQLADNKANVLLSLNAIMITFLLPMILSNLEVILEAYLFIPLIILAITCFSTIYISAIVLKPSNLDEYRESSTDDPDAQLSPFFFGNFHKMSPEEFFDYMGESASNTELVKAHLIQDLYYIGRRLGYKMDRIRLAFNIFLIGLFLTFISAGIVIYFL
ncbi:MAG: Pycsar system effector family protein [Bacteroidota bacterium]